jgi:hypothetical protein
MDAVGTLRYDHVPVLQSILAYGAETNVPDHDICRLSYYVKCCVVGCGIDIPLLDETLLDYMTAHTLPPRLQELIKHFAYRELSLEKLINRAFILDEQHILLPRGTLNTFFEFKTASTYFTVNCFDIDSGQQVHFHKVMLCTLKWLLEYYINPFFREQQANALLLPMLVGGDCAGEWHPAIEILAILMLSIRGLRQQYQQPLQPTNSPLAGGRAISQQYYDGREYHIPGLNITERSTNSPRTQEGWDFTERDTTVIADVPVAIAVPIDEEIADSQMLVEATATILL